MNSIVRAMFDKNWNLHFDSAIIKHVIDRNSDYFGFLWDLLKTGLLYIHPKTNKKSIIGGI